MKTSKFIKVHVNKKNKQFSIVLPKKMMPINLQIRGDVDLLIRRDSLKNLKFMRRSNKND